jgi:transposase
MDELLTMSTKELSRVEVMQKLSEKGMSQKEAGAILHLSTRQIKRLLKTYRKKGAAGLVSKQRGRPSHNRLAEDVKKRALNLLKTKYQGFGPTLAHEKLVEKDKLKLSDESVRQLMIAEDLWKPRKVKKVVTHQLRERRACFGELIQIDGSPHDWFEGRAEACVLLVFIDDATGKLVQLRFVDSESFFSYGAVAESYFRQHGKPVAFYSDKHSIFRVNQPSAGSHDDLTQFGRAMQELNIQIICANTPQAKGRVERVIQTLQDRCPHLPWRAVPGKKCVCVRSRAGRRAMPIYLNSWQISTNALPNPRAAMWICIAPSPPKKISHPSSPGRKHGPSPKI